MKASRRTSPRVNWTKAELKVLDTLTTPAKIQQFLDSIPYSTEYVYRSPRSVLRDRKAHCFDGAMFAAAMLRRIGYPSLIMDMQAVRDDDHVIAIYKKNGFWGAVAKSNFVTLRFREPVYKTFRELVLSYFEFFFNVNKEKSMRQYTVPLDLATFDHIDWMTNDEQLDLIADKLSDIKVTRVMTPAMIRGLHRVDDRTYKAAMLGANKAGLYIP